MKVNQLIANVIQSERLSCWKKQHECKLLYSHNIAENDDMVIKLEDLREVWTDFEKFARFCTTLAMRVSVREVCSSGYSWVRLNKEGDMTAGHRKRRKREPLISRSAMSSLPLSAHRTRQDANTSFSSLGNALGETNNADYFHLELRSWCNIIFLLPLHVQDIQIKKDEHHKEG